MFIKQRKSTFPYFCYFPTINIIRNIYTTVITNIFRDSDLRTIDLVFKIAATGIIVAVLNQLLTRSGREDQAMMTTLAGLIVVLSMLVRQISDLFVLIKALFDL